MLTVCYQTLLIEFVTGDTVQHHVDKHPDGHAEGEGLDHLYRNATLEVGHEVEKAVAEGGQFEITTTSLRKLPISKLKLKSMEGFQHSGLYE